MSIVLLWIILTDCVCVLGHDIMTVWFFILNNLSFYIVLNIFSSLWRETRFVKLRRKSSEDGRKRRSLRWMHPRYEQAPLITETLTSPFPPPSLAPFVWDRLTPHPSYMYNLCKWLIFIIFFHCSYCRRAKWVTVQRSTLSRFPTLTWMDGFIWGTLSPSQRSASIKSVYYNNIIAGATNLGVVLGPL